MAMRRRKRAVQGEFWVAADELPSAIYFRLLLVGCFEGIDSERGVAWRLADALGLRQVAGYQVTDLRMAALASSVTSSASS